MNSTLQIVLAEHLKSDWQSNPALSTLVHDYTKYHAVMVILGGIVLLVSLLLAIYFGLRFKKVAKTGRLWWPFEKKIYFAFASVLTLFTAFIAILWVANLSTTLNPLPGFTSLASSTSVPSESDTGKALSNWVQSGDVTFPPVLKAKFEERIGWQRPKAIICGVLLVIFVFTTIRVWDYLIKKSRDGDSKWSFRDRLLIFGGAVTFVFCLLLTIMVVANAQGAIGPITISLLGVSG